MAWFDDWNNEASKAGTSQSWDDFYRAQEQQRIMDELRKKNTQPQGKGNILTSLIPTAGGVGGALAGAAGGAALGSVVPVVGTAVGGLLGALLGGAGGSAAGKVGQNAVEGNADLGEGVVQEALLGGLTSTPLGAGFKLAKAGVKATTGIGKKAAKDLVQEAGISTIGKGTAAKYGLSNPSTGIANKVGIAAEKKANQMLASQTGMTNAQARKAGIGSQVQTFGNVNRRTGLTNLDDMSEISRGLTGGGQDSLLDTLTRATLENTNGVNVGNLSKSAQNLIDNAGSLLSDSERKNILRTVKNASTTMYGGSKGSLSTLANPTAAFDQANAFRATANTLTSNPLTATPRDKQIAKVYNGLAKELEENIYKSPGIGESIPMLVREGSNDLLIRADDLAAAGNTKQANAYRKIATELGQVKDVKGLRSMKKDFVNLNKIDSATAQAEGSRTIGGRDMQNSVGSLMRNPLNLIGAPLDAATPTIAGGLATGARSLQGQGARLGGQGVLPLTARQGAGRLLTADVADVPQFDENGLTAEDYATLESNPLFNQGAGQPNTTLADQETPSNPFGISLADVAGQLQVAIQNGDSKGYATLSDLYDKINDYETNNANGGGALGATAKNGLASSANAVNTLNQLESMFGQAGGGSGRIVGGLQSLLGNAGLNNNVDLYNTQAGSTVTQLAKALNGGGQVTDADARVVIDALPKVTDNPEVAAQKFAALRQRLQTAAQNTSQFGSGNTDLSAILAQYAG